MDKIIKVSKKHIEQLAQIDFESGHQGDLAQNISKSSRRKGILDRFKMEQELFFGYERDEGLVGYVTLKPFFPGHKHCEVYWLVVKETCQGQGIGRKLMEFIEQYARKRGFRKVCLYTGKDMTKARGFYEKIGYSLINEFPGYYSYKTGNTTAVLYAKSL